LFVSGTTKIFLPINRYHFKKVTDITPPEIYLIDELKDKLINLGYDEVLTWPLVATPSDEKLLLKPKIVLILRLFIFAKVLFPHLSNNLINIRAIN
jgi:hypothetical protein